MIEQLLPAGVAAVEMFVDPPDATLYPEEEAVLGNSVPKRRTEFTTVRLCARHALGRLGLPAAPIVPGVRGAPTWPAEVVGSMTHCTGYRAAAVARARDLASLGIDAEPHEPMPPGTLDLISLAEERTHLAELSGRAGGICWDRLLFCAKEATYKTWSPLTRSWLGFQEATMFFDLEGTFTASLLVPGPIVAGRELSAFQGRWMVRDGLAVTTITVPAAPAELPPAPAEGAQIP